AGEKLSEELFNESEALTPTHHDKLLLAQHIDVIPKTLNALLSKLAVATDCFDQEKVEELLHQAIPELVGDGDDVDGNANVVSFTRGV
ncbi:MAG: polysaccharide biosynthesis protein, partial [Gammaproteobacteria bacterium]|nr:polysaccharide biosynthesis protein [Gammaproteobacteria bacterium]